MELQVIREVLQRHIHSFNLLLPSRFWDELLTQLYICLTYFVIVISKLNFKRCCSGNYLCKDLHFIYNL